MYTEPAALRVWHVKHYTSTEPKGRRCAQGWGRYGWDDTDSHPGKILYSGVKCLSVSILQLFYRPVNRPCAVDFLHYGGSILVEYEAVYLFGVTPAFKRLGMLSLLAVRE